MPRAGVPGKGNGLVAMSKRHLEAHTQEARAKQRKQLGSLKSLTVQPVTRARYDQALNDFFQYLKDENLVLPSQTRLMDSVVSDYLESLWAKGLGRTVASNTLAALQDSQPRLKGHLPQSWRLLKTWVTHEVPNRAPPFPLEVLETMVGYCLFKQRPLMALSLLLGFHGLLRTGEILSLKSSQVMVTGPKGPAVISLGLTKSGKRQGAAESVTIHFEDLCRRLRQWVSCCRVSTPLCQSSYSWRGEFNSILSNLGFDTWDFRPYSLRRGGATHAFKLHGSFDKLLVQGRWQSSKTARLYLNEGLAVLAEMRLSFSAFTKTFRKQYLQSLTLKLPPLEPAPREQGRGRWKKAKTKPKSSKNKRQKKKAQGKSFLRTKGGVPLCLGSGRTGG